MPNGDLDAYFKSRKPPGPLDVGVGDQVAYTRYFLKSIGVYCTDPSWSRRGEVLEVRGPLALVRWSDGCDERVSRANLAYPGPNLRFAE